MSGQALEKTREYVLVHHVDRGGVFYFFLLDNGVEFLFGAVAHPQDNPSLVAVYGGSGDAEGGGGEVRTERQFPDRGLAEKDEEARSLPMYEDGGCGADFRHGGGEGGDGFEIGGRYHEIVVFGRTSFEDFLPDYLE